jgi:predicted acylesterase/phospholipase RssA
MASARTAGDPESPECDPTSDPELVVRRDTALADAHLHAWIDRLNAEPLALVLSGGGGKGAYEAGVILALNDLGLTHFVSIAGTSVGGLNAAICHETLPARTRPANRNAILRIWTRMNHRSVLGLSFSAVPKLLLYAVASIGLLQNHRSLSMFAGDVDADLHSWTDVLVTASWGALGAALAGAVAGSVSFYIIFPVLKERAQGLVALLAFGGLFFVMPKLAGWMGRRLALFSNAPLRGMIESCNLASICDGAPAVACTLAERRPLPRPEPLSGGRPGPFYRPYYVPLNELKSTEWAIDVLLQTAALPEVFRPRVLFQRHCVDGGLADNTPFFGVYRQRPTTVIVVYLNDRYHRVSDLEQYERRRMMRILEGFDARPDDPMAEWARRVRIHPIIPSAPLGGLLRGTLNFGAKKARRLIALGYGDALTQLTVLSRSPSDDSIAPSEETPGVDRRS